MSENLTKYNLDNVDYKWVFKVYPVGDNLHSVKVMLKNDSMFSWFQKSLVKDEVIVDINRDFVGTMKNVMDRMLETVSDDVLSLNKELVA